MLVTPSASKRVPRSTSARTTQWSPASIRFVTVHSTHARAFFTTAQPLVSEMSTSSAPKRFSPGANGLSRAFMTSFSPPDLRTLRLNLPPVMRKLSTARSLATATVSAGGLKLA